MLAKEREERYTWGSGDSQPDIIPGDGEVLDLAGFLEQARAQDADGPAVRTIDVGQGVTFICETPRGHVRSGKDFAVQMPAHYGYIEGVVGADGDSLDAYYGAGPTNGWVYVVDQRHVDSDKFDEHKCMLNFPSQRAAVDAYMSGHHRSRDVFIDFTPMPLAEFARWMHDHDMRKPCSL